MVACALHACTQLRLGILQLVDQAVQAHPTRREAHAPGARQGAPGAEDGAEVPPWLVRQGAGARSSEAQAPCPWPALPLGAVQQMTQPHALQLVQELRKVRVDLGQTWEALAAQAHLPPAEAEAQGRQVWACWRVLRSCVESVCFQLVSLGAQDLNEAKHGYGMAQPVDVGMVVRQSHELLEDMARFESEAMV